MESYDAHIKKAEEIIMNLKQAFQPIPGAPAGAPPMDPAMMAQMQGAAPPMDPAMMAQMQGAAPPMDPAMMAQMQGGAAPSPGPDAGQLEGIVSELMSSMEQIAGALEQFQQQIGQLEAGMQGMAQENAQLLNRLDMLEKALNAPAPAEGIPGNMM